MIDRRSLLGLVGCALLAALPLVGCQPNQAAASRNGGGQVRVVATYSILGDLVQQVGGARVALRTLVGADGDAHTFDPSPADAAALVDAALIFENGLDFEPWLERLYEASRSRAKRVAVTEGVAPLFLIEDGRKEPDPHAWHDVNHVQLMVRAVRDALVAADNAHAATYRANADAYLNQLHELDRWVREQVQALPAERRKLVTSHDTFGYFAQRYGFQVVGSALPSFTTEAAEPSAGELARLAREIRAVGVPAIFAENVQNPRLVERLAGEAGVKLGPPLYTDALGKPGSDGDSYLKLMRWNVGAIVRALGQ